MFECKGCKAKDEEIAHLRANIDSLLGMLEKAQARITELAEPGINRRMNPPPPSAGWRMPPPQGVRVHPQYPGYEARMEQQFEITEPGEEKG